MEDRLEHKMLNHRLAPNIENKCNAGTNLGNIGKVLLRSHAEIRASGISQFLQLVDYMQIGSLVGYVVIGTKESIFFREFLDNAGKLRGRYALGLDPLQMEHLPRLRGRSQTEGQNEGSDSQQVLSDSPLLHLECLAFSKMLHYPL